MFLQEARQLFDLCLRIIGGQQVLDKGQQGFFAEVLL